MRIVTRTLDETVHMLQRGEVSFALLYHHAAIAVRLDGRQFSYLTMMSDNLPWLVPIFRCKPCLHRRRPAARPVPCLDLAFTAWRWGDWFK